MNMNIIITIIVVCGGGKEHFLPVYMCSLTEKSGKKKFEAFFYTRKIYIHYIPISLFK